ncbi:ABC-2 type transport system ATP-binding protein [Leucobacter exalbidus]|uniref:ABC-2 type transport system ATP-binding protein n=1 Tax=Leucobacter exalbidus TaxID=662960 RepID=A0A940PYX0_9MICO|nr:ABC transporter ATP-binding protein [Leucobacter exalbidus]MBP1326681.1 ABC-2 type transport system ATP-binding protein [Leucobacter exalbidus]
MTAIAIETRGLTRSFRGTVALDDVTLDIHENVITGLLGRNGSGKTTLMSLITAQDQATSGVVHVGGVSPFEHAEVIERMCFIRDNQRYPDDYKLKHALRAAAIGFPNWSQETADRLVKLFRIPTKPIVKKFSRGQLSALGIVLGLAARAPITFFDEPYLGLDATARSIFYEELMRDYGEHPRTIIVSTHLIDEMDQLLERVIVLDRGRVVRHSDVEEMRGGVFQLSGRASVVASFVTELGLETVSQRTIGGLGTAVIEGVLSPENRAAAAAGGLEITPVSLQDLVAAYGVGEPDGAAGGAAGASSAAAATSPASSDSSDQSGPSVSLERSAS